MGLNLTSPIWDWYGVQNTWFKLILGLPQVQITLKKKSRPVGHAVSQVRPKDLEKKKEARTACKTLVNVPVTLYTLHGPAGEGRNSSRLSPLL